MPNIFNCPAIAGPETQLREERTDKQTNGQTDGQQDSVIGIGNIFILYVRSPDKNWFYGNIPRKFEYKASLKSILP